MKRLPKAFDALEDACRASERDAMRIADQLDRWADESRDGGWSTHQVDPMRRLAAEIRKDDKRRIALELAEEL